ncbi:MAG: ArnT family glycosyltransferase, partial [Promethearchaeota archaeon]
FKGILRIENDLNFRELLLLGFIFLITIYFCYFHLEYSEFIADEAEVAFFSKDLIIGNSDAVFSYLKGPTQLLVPIPYIILHGYWTELVLRVPFAFAGTIDVFLIFILAKRMFSKTVGLTSSLLYSVTGFNIAFTRLAQYQTILTMTMLLSMLFLYEALKSKKTETTIRKNTEQNFLLGSFFFAFGIFTHYDMIFFSFPIIFFFYRLFDLKYFYKDRVSYLALFLFIFFTSIFYVPFVLNPEFTNTVDYYLQHRVGVGSPPIINLGWLLASLSLYSSSYLALFLLICPFFNFLKRNLTIELTILIIWFFSFFIPYTLILRRPGSHFYTFFPSWTILSILGLNQLYNVIMEKRIDAKKDIPFKNLKLNILKISIFMILFLSLLIPIYYSHMVYIDHESLYVYSYPENKNEFYFDLHPLEELGWKFGFPYKVGWKVIGFLFKSQQLIGPYFTNEDPRVPDFYTDQQPSKVNVRYYLLVKYIWNEVELNETHIKTTYNLIGIVYVNNKPTISIYETTSPIDDNYTRYDLEAYEKDYDLRYRKI